jgi:proteasome lid subunit RPN8/RPN11
MSTAAKLWCLAIRMTLVISQPECQAIRHHAEREYPRECCGVLAGRISAEGTKTVRTVIPCRNVRGDSPQNRYEISPEELLRIQRQCREDGYDIVGFYHSHPDHPAQWSGTDLAEAHWTGCSYVITSVEQGRATQTKSFTLRGDAANDMSKYFEYEEIEIV